MSETREAYESTEDKRSRGSLRVIKKVLGFVWSNWLVLGFGLACVLGYFFPRMSRECVPLLGILVADLRLDVAARGGVIRSEYSILYAGIALIFFINGMQLSPEKLKEHAKNWRLHIVVQGISLVLIPVIQLST